MRLLKFLVVSMGMLIIAGLAIIVITIYNRSSPSFESQVNIELNISEGSIILNQTIDKNKLFVYIRRENSSEVIKVYDIFSGKELREINIKK